MAPARHRRPGRLLARPRGGRLGVADRRRPGHDCASGPGRPAVGRPSRPRTTPRPTPGSPPRGGGRLTSDANKLKSLADQRAEELAEASEDYAIAASTTSAEKRDKALKDQAEEARRSGEAAGRAGTRATAGRPPGARRQRHPGRRQGLPAAGLLPDRRPVRSGRDLVALPHRLRLLRRDRHPDPGPVGRRGDQRRHRSGQRLGGQLRGHPVPGRHLDADGPHVDRVGLASARPSRACQVVGAVGMTGRTFGPHVHFEVYPAEHRQRRLPGGQPPAWLNARGLNP